MSGTGAPCRMRWPEPGASSSRSRWDWRRSPHFRVRTDRPRITPCQVNSKKSINSLSSGPTATLRLAPWQKSRVNGANWAVEWFTFREGLLKVKPHKVPTQVQVQVWSVDFITCQLACLCYKRGVVPAYIFKKKNPSQVYFPFMNKRMNIFILDESHEYFFQWSINRLVYRLSENSFQSPRWCLQTTCFVRFVSLTLIWD